MNDEKVEILNEDEILTTGPVCFAEPLPNQDLIEAEMHEQLMKQQPGFVG